MSPPGTSASARTPIEARPAERARVQAASLMAAVGRLPVAGIDVAPALEQQLYFALRDGTAAGRTDVTQTVGRARRSGAGMAIWRRAWAAARAGTTVRRSARRLRERHPVLAVIRAPIHAELLDPVAEALRSIGGPPTAVLSIGQAADAGVELPLIGATDLWRLPGAARDAWAVRRRLRGELGRATGSDLGAGELGAAVAVLVAEVPRIAMAAVGLVSACRAYRPALLATFDEVGSLGRLVSSTAHAQGIGAIDLPHAEIGSPWGLVGAAFDRIAVYGPVSAERARAVGIEDERIVIVGSVRHDGLSSSAEKPRAGTAGTVHIAFAAQYPAPWLPEAIQLRALRALLDGAAAAGAGRVELVRHPAQPSGWLEASVRALPVPPGLEVRVADDGLPTVLRRSTMLATVTSQSVLEAAVLGTPALMVQPEGGTYDVPYLAEGMALRGTDAESVAAAIVAAHDPPQRAALVAAARRVIADHLGPLDGGAAQRIALTMRDMIEAPRTAAAGG